ncbi:MAG: glycosyltransferase family 4 protein [bacterium]|nr:glycosyltransferase family 4 protein [bacterium]
MKIVIATGIYPPEVGGPSYYARGLAEALRAAGHHAPVVTYGVLKRLPTGIRHLAYMIRLVPHLIRADTVIALDTFSVALPVVLLARLFRVPVIIRTGGDFVWEHYLERTGNLLPLVRFYAVHKPFTRKEHAIFSLTRWVVRRAGIVFSTEMQRDIWVRAYGVDAAKTHVIGNAVDAPLSPEPPRAKNFLWHVRPIAMKNGGRLHAAFARARVAHPDITLEEGLIPKEELLERMKSCYAVILPSITEISPNYILDALRFKKPFIMDKYSGFAQWLAPYGTLVDPLDEDDIVRAIDELATDDGYARACERAGTFSYVRTYDDVARDFLGLVRQ